MAESGGGPQADSSKDKSRLGRYALPILTYMALAVFAIFAAASLYLHYFYFTALPDPFFQPDSPGYYLPAINLWLGRPFGLSLLRTPGYPLFIAAILEVSPHFSSVMMVQHVIHVLTAVVSGALFFLFFKRSVALSFLVFLVVMLLPRPLVYAHTIMSDNLYALVFMVSLFLFFGAVEWGNSVLAAGAAIFSCLALFVRPVGLTLVGSLAFGFILLSGKTRQKLAVTYFLAVAILLLGWASWNHAKRGFWGITQKNGEVLFGSAAFLMDAQSLPPEYAGELEPILKSHPNLLSDHSWVMYDAAGPAAKLRQLTPTQEELDFQLRRLAVRAIETHPFRYAVHYLNDVLNYVLYAERPPEHITPKEYALAKGLSTYLHLTKNIPEARKLLKFNSNNFTNYFTDVASYSLYPFEIDTAFARAAAVVYLYGYWIPAAAVLFSLLLMFYGPLGKRLVFLLTLIFLHLYMTSMGAGVDGRYALNLEPLYFILFLNGLLSAAQLLKLFGRRHGIERTLRTAQGAPES